MDEEERISKSPQVKQRDAQRGPYHDWIGKVADVASLACGELVSLPRQVDMALAYLKRQIRKSCSQSRLLPHFLRSHYTLPVHNIALAVLTHITAVLLRDCT